MHVYTPDGRTLLVLDAFGLTRLTLPVRTRTEPKIMGSPRASLCVDRDGARVLASSDGWQQTYVLGVADFKPQMKSERFKLAEAQLLPDGQRVARIDNGVLRVSSLDGLNVYGTPIPRAGSAVIALGEGPPQPPGWEQSLRVAHDGTVALHTAQEGGAQLHLGALDARGALSVAGSWTLDLRGGGARWLHPRDGAVDVLWHDLARARAFVVRVDAGGVVARFELPAYGTPALRDDRWVVQTAPDAVAELDRDGSTLRAWTLPEGLHGEGEVMPGARTLFMPSDRERFYDLDSGEMIPRNLKAAELPVRAYFTSTLARHNLAARRFGRALYLSEVRYWSNRTSAGGQLGCSLGDGSFGGAAVAAMLFQRFARGERTLGAFQSGGVGARGYSTSFERPIAAAEVEALFEACDEGGLWLGDLRDLLSDVFGTRFTVSTDTSRAMEASEPHAFELLLRGLLHHLIDPSAPKLAPEVPEWKSRPLDADALRALILRVDAKSKPVEYGNLDALVMLVARVLPVDAAGPTLLWMTLDIDPLFTSNSVQAIALALGRLKSQRPELAEVWRAQVEAHDPVFMHGADKREALRAALAP